MHGVMLVELGCGCQVCACLLPKLSWEAESLRSHFCIPNSCFLIIGLAWGAGENAYFLAICQFNLG